MPGFARSCRRTADVQLARLVGRPEREHGDAPFKLYQREPEGKQIVIFACFLDRAWQEERRETSAQRVGRQVATLESFPIDEEVWNVSASFRQMVFRSQQSHRW